MKPSLGHGPRISDEEYDRRIVDLYTGVPEAPSCAQQTRLRRHELDLTIDHRLGCAFPQDRRDALWAIQQRVEKQRVRLMLRHLFRRLLPGALERGAQGLAGYLVDEYAKILSPGELESYFGETEARTPRLPIDRGLR